MGAHRGPMRVLRWGAGLGSSGRSPPLVVGLSRDRASSRGFRTGTADELGLPGRATADLRGRGPMMSLA